MINIIYWYRIIIPYAVTVSAMLIAKANILDIINYGNCNQVVQMEDVKVTHKVN